MRLTYDPEVDAAYILDFTEDGKLLGLEILFASDTLPASVLAAAEPLQ